MSLLTEMMRSASKERNIITIQHEDGTWSASEMVNHPTPSESDRWLMTYSDNRTWINFDIAKAEFEKLLPPYNPQL